MPASPRPDTPVLLTERKRRWLDQFMGAAAGNATEAVILAKITKNRHSATVIGTRMLADVRVQAAIAERRQVLTSQSIADATERREILTGIMRGEPEANARIRAVDVANKMDGLYIDKHEVELKVPGSIAFRIVKQPGAENRT